MPKALVFYHYFHPDDVVSAQHYADLCTGLKERGWEVTVMPCNRGCRDESVSYKEQESLRGVEIQRIWRPPFRQASFLGRLLNSTWMVAAWSMASMRHTPDVLIVGTDPVFAILTALPWKWLRPQTKIFHWCFDLHPEAAIADGMFPETHPFVSCLRPLLKAAYASCDLHGSLGPCMSKILYKYSPTLTIETFTPWALSEPSQVLAVDREEREAIFGKADLTLMYSGNFGKAHSFGLILALARRLRDHEDIRFAFSVRGNRVDALKEAVTPEDTNIRFVGFAPQERLEQRLGAADIQLVSLQPAYSGTVVPSKFQGALAAGRPILYSGPADTAVALWISEFKLGWTLEEGTLETTAQSILAWKRDPSARRAMSERCFHVYQEHFSKASILDRLGMRLRGLLEP